MICMIRNDPPKSCWVYHLLLLTDYGALIIDNIMKFKVCMIRLVVLSKQVHTNSVSISDKVLETCKHRVSLGDDSR